MQQVSNAMVRILRCQEVISYLSVLLLLLIIIKTEYPCNSDSYVRYSFSYIIHQVFQHTASLNLTYLL